MSQRTQHTLQDHLLERDGEAGAADVQPHARMHAALVRRTHSGGGGGGSPGGRQADEGGSGAYLSDPAARVLLEYVADRPQHGAHQAIEAARLLSCDELADVPVVLEFDAMELMQHDPRLAVVIEHTGEDMRPRAVRVRHRPRQPPPGRHARKRSHLLPRCHCSQLLPPPQMTCAWL